MTKSEIYCGPRIAALTLRSAARVPISTLRCGARAALRSGLLATISDNSAKWFAALTFIVALSGCAGRKGTLSLTLVTSPVDNPLQGGNILRVTIGDKARAFPIVSGVVTVDFDLSPLDGGAILVEVFDAADSLIAYGSTPVIPIVARDQGPYSIWIGRPGRFSPGRAALTSARAEMAAVTIPGLGLLFAGGRDSSGQTLRSANVYDALSHVVIEATPMAQPRAAAAVVAIPAKLQAILYGGAGSAGFGTATMLQNSAELFDPTTGVGSWSPIPSDGVEARAYATTTALRGENALLSGGIGASGTALQSSALLVTGAAGPRVSALPSFTSVPRVHQAASVATFPEGAGVLLFGGLGMTPPPTAPAMEKWVTTQFTAYGADVVPADQNRDGATATELADGRVLIAGGRSTTVVASGLVITPGATPTVSPIAALLSAARVDHTAIRVGTDVLICGGRDSAGDPLASCDLIDGVTLGLKETIALGTARYGQSMVALDTGVVVVAGGFGAGDVPLASIELYTPRK